MKISGRRNINDIFISLFSIFCLTSFSQKKMTLYFDTNSSELSQKELVKFNEFMKTKDLKEKVLNADIIIAAIGKPGFVTADMVKEGAVVVDVGTTRVVDASKKNGWALKGDVKFDEVSPKCSYITPVPGGVGPMTIASLMINTLKAMALNNK